MNRKSLVVAVVVLALLVGSVGIAYAITNGEPDGENHPYVGLMVAQNAGGTALWRCSGTLLSPTLFLTAGHCVEAPAAHVEIWFDADVESGIPANGYPDTGDVGGTPHTNPDYCPECGNGLPGFAYRDVGVVVLDEPMIMDKYGELPEAGAVDSLRNKTGIDFVGYGVQEEVRGGGPPYWTGLRVRFYAPSELVSGKFVHSDEFMKLSLNHSKDKGGTCFGDSGGPDLLRDTNTVLAVNSYVTNYNCAGVGYSSRVDIPEVLEWINGFLD